MTSSPLPPEPEEPVRTYLELRPNLLRFFAARLGSTEAAEDLMQELYLRAAKAAPGEAVQNPRSWLFTAGSNILIDLRRTGQRSAARDGAWTRDVQPSDDAAAALSTPTPETIVSGRQRLSRVLERVDAMPPRMAEAFRLHKLQGLSQAQTAQRMGVSQKAVEKHLAAALHRLVAETPEGER